MNSESNIKGERRTRLLINRRFQLRYIGLFLGVAFFTSLIIGGTLYYIVHLNTELQLLLGLHHFPEVLELAS